MPSAPNWIRTSTITCPAKLNSVAVSTTTRPVTQVALTAVKNPSRGSMVWPGALQSGKDRSNPPTRESPVKNKTNSSAGRDQRKVRAATRCS